MRKLKGAVFGLGVGREWARSFARHEKTELAAVFDPDPGRAQSTTSEFGGDVCSSWEEIVARDDIDIVAVMSPDAFHAGQGVAALEADKHLIITKPMVTTMKECDAIAAAADKTEKKSYGFFSERYSPRYQFAHQYIEEGKLGGIFYAEAYYIVNFHFESSRGFRAEKEHRHIPLLGSACHVIDQLSWHVGRIVEVSAYGNRMCYTEEQYPFWDCQVAICKFENGAVGKLFSSYGAVHPHENNMQIFGTKGTIDGYRDRIYTADNEWNTWSEMVEKSRIEGHGTLGALDHFLTCIEEDTQPMTDIRHGAYVVAVALAAEESILTGKPVAVKQF